MINISEKLPPRQEWERVKKAIDLMYENMNTNKNVNENENANKKANVFQTFQATFGRFPTPLQTDELKQYLGFGMDEDLLCYGLEKTAMNGATFRYALKIFDSWLDERIMTLAAAKERDQKYQGGRKNGSYKQDSGQEKPKSKFYW